MIEAPAITIIGGGLSAIYAFWGCLDSGYDPDEVQVLHNTRGVSAGAVFMYETPIPWPSTKVTSILIGTPDQYSMNQWGVVKETSVNKRFNNGKRDTIMEHMVIPDDILPTLWGMIPNQAECPILDQESFDRLKARRKAVICCFPDKAAKEERQQAGHLFHFPVYISAVQNREAIVIYNGLQTVPWVRQTFINGAMYTEYARGTKETDIKRYEHTRGNGGGFLSMSPDFTPDCPAIDVKQRTDGNLLRVGRSASFQAGFLSHMVRDEVNNFLEKLNG